MKVAVCQFEIAGGKTAENLAFVKKAFSKAKEQGADAIILPELFNCGYTEDFSAIAESSKGKTVNTLSKLCAENGIALLGGSFIEKKDGSFFNTSLAIDDKGSVIAKYRKAHLFDGEFRESDIFAAGSEWCIFDFAGIQAGLFTCFDLRFPVFIQNLALRGARLLCCCAQWPEKRLDNWCTLLKARAVENEAWLIACNAVGQGHFQCAGHSMVIAPDGTVIAEAGKNEELLFAEIDFEQQGAFNILNRRRPILDEIDETQL